MRLAWACWRAGPCYELFADLPPWLRLLLTSAIPHTAPQHATCTRYRLEIRLQRNSHDASCTRCEHVPAAARRTTLCGIYNASTTTRARTLTIAHHRTVGSQQWHGARSHPPTRVAATPVDQIHMPLQEIRMLHGGIQAPIALVHQACAQMQWEVGMAAERASTRAGVSAARAPWHACSMPRCVMDRAPSVNLPELCFLPRGR